MDLVFSVLLLVLTLMQLALLLCLYKRIKSR